MAISRRHPAALFAVLAVGLGTTGAAYAAVTTVSTPKAAVVSETQIEQGKQLFMEGCSSCHGLAAQGSSDGPSLIGVGAAAVDFQVSTGRMPMAANSVQAPRGKSSYSEEETAALAAYVASLGGGPAIPTAEMVDATDAELALGGELFRTNCAQCHSVSGRGGALSEGGKAPSLLEATPTQIYEAMIVGPGAMPVFSENTLNEDDKKSIIRYIEELKTGANPGGYSLGRLGTVTEGLFLMVFGLGALIVASVWIGAKSK